MNYYNENDPYAAEWLRRLIAAGSLPNGYVDERSIEDVKPEDLHGYDQCHFFAGDGGWALAVRWSGYEGPIWTGSCPCQPFSSAGTRTGDDDPRALWWAWRWLIEQCQPPVVFGEQVASKDGRAWLSNVRADLETMDYAVGAADLCAAGVGAPHLRQRLWWFADARDERGEGFFPANRAGEGGPRWSFGPEDLQQVYENPFHGGERYPQPLLRKMDDGLSGRVGRIRAYGNAIVPQVATEFILTCLEEA